MNRTPDVSSSLNSIARPWLSALALPIGLSLFGACTSTPNADAPNTSKPTTSASSAPNSTSTPAASTTAPTTPSVTASTTPPPSEHFCTDKGCLDGFLITVTPSDSWPVGKYTFDLDGDGEKLSCAGSLPLPDCKTSALTCKGSLKATIVQSGCALPAAKHAFGDIEFARTDLKNVKVKITHNGKTLTDTSFQPTYKTSRPNGPNCGPVCQSSTASLKLFLVCQQHCFEHQEQRDGG